MGEATLVVHVRRMTYSIADIRQAHEALDRAWQNAKGNEAARKDIEAAMQVLQAGQPLFEADEAQSV